MARVQLTAAHLINHVKLKAGTKVADSAGAAQAGDYVWTGLTSATFSNAMVPLDASAITMQAGSRFATGPTMPYPDGVNSIT